MINNLEKLLAEAERGMTNENINLEARLFRGMLLAVKDKGHLKDLVGMFFNYTRLKNFDPDSSMNYLQLCERLAKTELSTQEFVLGVAVLAPAIQNIGWGMFCREVMEANAKAAERQAEQERYWEEHRKRQAQITKIDMGSSPHYVQQLWVADSAELLEAEGRHQLECWPTGGYSTRVGTIAQEIEGEHKGKFVCRFSRGTSAD